ncbi:MAG: hypothetical protein H7Y17_14675 [Chlorobia bacterium]|nr:hypothetical protein [Fimbriimonadaceae bacterium]
MIQSSNTAPKLIVLVHGMSSAPSDAAMPGVPEPNANSLDYNRFYWSPTFVQNLLGSNSLKTLSGVDVSGSRWEAHGTPNSNGKVTMTHGCRDSNADDHFIVKSSFSGGGTPDVAIFSSYRDASVHIMPQTKRLINQLYDAYVAKFGTKLAPKPGMAAPNIIFVCHSMGGLAVRTLLAAPTTSIGGVSLTPGERQKAQALRDRTAYVVTLATPHDGSQIADRVTDIKSAIDNDSNWTALNFLSQDITEAIRGTLRGQIRATAIEHLRSDFWRNHSGNAIAPYRMERTDGSHVPVYTLAGHAPGGRFFTNPTSASQFPAGSIDMGRLGEEGYRREVIRSVGLLMLDYFLHSVPGGSGPKNWGATTRSDLDIIARYHRERFGAGLSAPNEAVSAPLGLPTFFNREASSAKNVRVAGVDVAFPATKIKDGMFDADGMVGTHSGLALNLGTNQSGFFEHGAEWNTPDGSVFGSFYRVAPIDDGEEMPWVYKNHETIHRGGAVGEWVRQNLIERAGPLPGSGPVSFWPAPGLQLKLDSKGLISKLESSQFAKLRAAAANMKLIKIAKRDDD